MRCLKSFLVALFVCCLSFLITLANSNDTYALDDISISFENPLSQIVLCDNSDSSKPDCSGYNFLYVTSDWWWPTNVITISYKISGSAVSRSLQYNPYIDSMFDFSEYSVTYLAFASSTSGFGSSDVIHGTILLSENNPFQSSSGSLSITQNGTYNVESYSSVDVNVPAEVIEGDYHQDLVDIKSGIYVCAAVLLVLYFFYCIYRMIIKPLGGK